MLPRQKYYMQQPRLWFQVQGWLQLQLLLPWFMDVGAVLLQVIFSAGCGCLQHACSSRGGALACVGAVVQALQVLCPSALPPATFCCVPLWPLDS
jgi:hypothetical protein